MFYWNASDLTPEILMAAVTLRGVPPHFLREERVLYRYTPMGYVQVADMWFTSLPVE